MDYYLNTDGHHISTADIKAFREHGDEPIVIKADDGDFIPVLPIRAALPFLRRVESENSENITAAIENLYASLEQKDDVLMCVDLRSNSLVFIPEGTEIRQLGSYEFTMEAY